MALGLTYRPADPAAVLAGWRRGMPHLPVPDRPGWRGGLGSRDSDPWHAVLAASGRPAGPGRAGAGPGTSWARLARPRRARRR
jgi:hypothetical protein